MHFVSNVPLGDKINERRTSLSYLPEVAGLPRWPKYLLSPSDPVFPTADRSVVPAKRARLQGRRQQMMMGSAKEASGQLRRSSHFKTLGGSGNDLAQ
ncbi:hypothetical protein PoB_004297800 [Plakobranchus ocellatus]|uniref:Uncharacterized protein n=1 Tax=Plakobranchus ocellatus TaxID=259542 RepID=A0AAV4BBC5_9GAST|nr:hypothetical protein PoB_004297800 [Plakobranchus ocellatus]